MRHRFRRRLGPRQAARTARHLRHSRHDPVRLLLCRERPHGYSARTAIGEPELRRVAGRGALQEASQFRAEIFGGR